MSKDEFREMLYRDIMEPLSASNNPNHEYCTTTTWADQLNKLQRSDMPDHSIKSPPLWMQKKNDVRHQALLFRVAILQVHARNNVEASQALKKTLELRSLIQALEERVISANNHAENLDRMCVDYQNKFCDLESTNRELSFRLSAVERARDEAIDTLESESRKIEELQNQNKNLESKLLEREAAITSLIAKTEQTQHAHDTEMGELFKQLERVNHDLASSKQAILQLQNDFEAANCNIATVEEKLVIKQKELEAVREERFNQAQECKSIVAHTKFEASRSAIAYDNQILSLQALSNDLQAALNASRAREESMMTTNTQLKQALGQRDTTIARLQSELQSFIHPNGNNLEEMFAGITYNEEDNMTQSKLP